MASDNSVIVGQGSSVGGSLYGGYASFEVKAGVARGGIANGAPGPAFATINATGSKVLANNNEVIFNGDLQSGDIYGGYAKFYLTQGTAEFNDSSLGDATVSLADSRAEGPATLSPSGMAPGLTAQTVPFMVGIWIIISKMTISRPAMICLSATR